MNGPEPVVLNIPVPAPSDLGTSQRYSMLHAQVVVVAKSSDGFLSLPEFMVKADVTNAMASLAKSSVLQGTSRTTLWGKSRTKQRLFHIHSLLSFQVHGNRHVFCGFLPRFFAMSRWKKVVALGRF